MGEPVLTTIFRNGLEHFGEPLLKGQEPLTSGHDNLKTVISKARARHCGGF